MSRIIQIKYLAFNKKGLLIEELLPNLIANCTSFKDAEKLLVEYLKRVNKAETIEVLGRSWVKNENNRFKTINNGNERYS